MNIMLATVTERTREIGIRRALGAKRRDIIQQFLIECVVLSGVGGLSGVLLGMAIPQLIVYFLPDQKTIVTLQSVLLAFGVSVVRRHPVRPLPGPARGTHGPDRGPAARVSGRSAESRRRRARRRPIGAGRDRECTPSGSSGLIGMRADRGEWAE